MHNTWLDFFVKERKPPCKAKTYVSPCFPVEINAAGILTYNSTDLYLEKAKVDSILALRLATEQKLTK